jgi:hypothetical protein
MVEALLADVTAMRARAAVLLGEELQIHRRDLMSRLVRRRDEKASPPARDILRARRERRARDREHSMKNVTAPPRKCFSTRLRMR